MGYSSSCNWSSFVYSRVFSLLSTDYWNYCVALVQQRMVSPDDDLPSDMLATRDGDDSILTIEDINNVVFGLLLAGHETTTNMSANAILTNA